MFKRIKRGASRMKEKLRRAFRIHEPGASATQPVIPNTHGASSRPQPSHVNIPAAHMPSVAILPQPKTDPASIPGAPSSPKPRRAPSAPSLPISASPYAKLHGQVLHPSPRLPAPTSANSTTSMKARGLEARRGGASSAPAPKATAGTIPKSNDAGHKGAAPTVSRSPDAARKVKHVAWAGFKALLNVVSPVSVAFPPLQAAVGGLLKCIEIYEDQITAKEEYNKLWIRLGDLCQDISKYMGGTASPSMTPCVQTLARGLEEQTKLVRQKLDRTVVQRGVEGKEDADEVMKCSREIEALLQRLSANANLETWRIVEEEATRNRLNELPNSPKAQYKSTASGNLGRHACTPNTRVDVLEQLHSWAGSGESRRIYWLNGMAGTGKTTIAYSLCEHIESASKLAASFFCSRQSPECRDVGRILPSIAYQLSLFSRPFRYAISKVLESNPLAHNKPPEEQFESLIATPLREIKDTLPSDLVIVIDALDECDSAEGMDEMLSALLAHAPDLPVKLFLTSRPNQNILDQMGSEGAERVRSLLHLHDLDRSVVQSDIKTYLTAELGRVKLNTTDLNRLVEQSGVLFVYAATVVRYLKYRNFSRSAERLKQVLSATASDGGEHRQLDALYTTVLEAALGDDSLRDSEREQMTLVIRTVVCAQEPLSVNDIAGLLGRSAESVRADLGPLLSVLQISKTGVVTTLHESFPDYLFDDKRSKRFYCDRKIHNAWFARACFAQLSAPNPPFNICNLESSYLLDKEVPGLQDRVKNTISPLLFYACRYWGAHVEATEPSEVLSDLFDFLSKRLLLWMEIMNLKQEIQSGMGTVSKLNLWLSHVQCSKELRDLARDAVRFVTEFATGEAKDSTPHIYISMLGIWPQGSPISMHYSKCISGLTKASGTAIGRESALIRTIEVSEGLCGLAYSPDGARLVSGSDDNTIRIWDAHTGQMVGQPLEGHTDSVWSVAYSSDGARIASGSKDKTIRIWDAHTGQMVGQPLEGHTDFVSSVAYSSDGARIVSGSADKTIRIWDAHTGQMVGQPLQGHTDRVLSVAYSSDGGCIVSCSYDKTIRIWDARTGQMVGKPLQGHTDLVTSVAYSSDGARIVSGSSDKTIRIWDAHTGQMVGQPLEGHTDVVFSVAYSTDGARIVSVSTDDTIRIWDAHTGQTLGQLLDARSGSLHSAAYSSDGARIVSGSNYTIMIWDAYAGHTVGQLPQAHTESVWSVAYSSDGARIISGCADKSIRIWDAHTGKMISQPLQGHTGTIFSVAYSSDGARIVSGSEDKTIRIWDAHTGQMVGRPLQGHTNWVWSVAYSSDGARIVSGSNDHTIRIWDAHTGQMVGSPLEGLLDFVFSVAYSSDGARIVSGSNDNTIRIWDAHTGAMVGQPLQGHTHRVWSVAYSSDGARIVSGSEDKTIRIWDAHTGKPFGEPLRGHTRAVFSVAYSSDGTRVVSGSADGTVRIWNAHTGQLIGQPLRCNISSVLSVAYSSDGAHVVSGSSVGTIRIWDAYAAQVITPPLERDSHRVNLLTRWSLGEDGWVLTPELRRLIWVPPHLRDALLYPVNTVVISTRGFFKLDFSHAKFGEDWRQCFHPS